MALFVIDKQPTRRQLLVFGIGLPILSAWLGWQLFRADFATAARAVWAGGALVSLAFALIASARKPIYLAWMHLIFPIGFVVSLALLLFVYFLVLTPLALISRLFGKDSMHRAFDRTAKSYWIERTEARPRASYFRQF